MMGGKILSSALEEMQGMGMIAIINQWSEHCNKSNIYT
jgi:hypothetical protein